MDTFSYGRFDGIQVKTCKVCVHQTRHPATDLSVHLHSMRSSQRASVSSRVCTLWLHNARHELPCRPACHAASVVSIAMGSGGDSLEWHPEDLNPTSSSSGETVPAGFLAASSRPLAPSHGANDMCINQARPLIPNSAAAWQSAALLLLGAGSLPVLTLLQAADTAVTGLVAISQWLSVGLTLGLSRPMHAPPTPLAWAVMVCTMAVLAVLPILSQVVPCAWHACSRCCAAAWHAVGSSIAAVCSSADGCSVLDFTAASTQHAVAAAGRATSNGKAVMQLCVMYMLTWIAQPLVRALAVSISKVTSASGPRKPAQLAFASHSSWKQPQGYPGGQGMPEGGLGQLHMHSTQEQRP